MKTETNYVKIGGTLYMRIPPQVAKHIGVDENSRGIIQDEEGKHGTYISSWKK